MHFEIKALAFNLVQEQTEATTAKDICRVFLTKFIHNPLKRRQAEKNVKTSSSAG